MTHETFDSSQPIPVKKIPRIYDMNSPVPVQEYIDAHTNVQLIVKRDVLDITFYEIRWCEYGVSLEEINEAISRLMMSAGLMRSDKER
jgi:hypothetical protein